MVRIEDSIEFKGTAPANDSLKLKYKLGHKAIITGFWITFALRCEDKFTVYIQIDGSDIGGIPDGGSRGYQGDNKTIFIPYRKEHKRGTEITVEGISSEAYSHTIDVLMGYEYETLM